MTDSNDRRRDVIDGLCLIAHFLEQHPEVPLPFLRTVETGQWDDTLQIYLIGKEAALLPQIAAAMGDTETVETDEHVRVFHRFAGIALVAQADREAGQPVAGQAPAAQDGGAER